jgi:hypothetical protein
LRQALADPALPLRDRVRMACSLGAVFGAFFMAGDAFDNVASGELGALVRGAVHDVVAAPDLGVSLPCEFLHHRRQRVQVVDEE